jgi:hypothetical protein
MRGSGEFAGLLRQRFNVATRKLGYAGDGRYQLDKTKFTRCKEQQSLF